MTGQIAYRQVVDAGGTKHWYVSGKRHREDGPAVEYADGSKVWYLNGKRHREDGPAIEYADGTKFWYVNGERHCKDGPAAEWADGSKYWYRNGELHREDSPAIEYADGRKVWYLNGKRHREDGPAIEYANGDKYWYVNGERHREDGPAIEWADGSKQWYVNDKLLTESEFNARVKPVTEQIEYKQVVDVDGDKYWYRNNKRHREDGPAIEYADGRKHWYLNGKLHREDGPAIEWANGNKYWYFNSKLHREDGPAIEYANGTKRWCVNGELHREDGPAIEYASGTKRWYLNGEKLTEEEFNQRVKPVTVSNFQSISDAINLQIDKMILAEIEPVADWFDFDGENGEPVRPLDALNDIAQMLLEDRHKNLYLKKVLRTIAGLENIPQVPASDQPLNPQEISEYAREALQAYARKSKELNSAATTEPESTSASPWSAAFTRFVVCLDVPETDLPTAYKQMREFLNLNKNLGWETTDEWFPPDCGEPGDPSELQKAIGQVLTAEELTPEMPKHLKYRDLINRLRGIYTIPINDGAGPLNGETVYERRCSYANLPPINEEAASAIGELLQRLDASS